MLSGLNAMQLLHVLGFGIVANSCLPRVALLLFEVAFPHARSQVLVGKFLPETLGVVCLQFVFWDAHRIEPKEVTCFILRGVSICIQYSCGLMAYLVCDQSGSSSRCSSNYLHQ